MKDVSNVGTQEQYKTVVEAHDSEHGEYQDKIHQVQTEQRLPHVALPQAPEPAPFTLGPMTGGGR